MPRAVNSGGATHWRRAAVIPCLWLIALFLVPFLIVFKISVSETAIAQPPYVPVLDLSAGWEGLTRFLAALSFDNYAVLVSDQEDNRVVALSFWNTREDAEQYHREQFQNVHEIVRHLLEDDPEVHTFDVHTSTIHKIAAGKAA